MVSGGRDDDCVRLSDNAIHAIRRQVLETAGAQARVRLFGSRTDERARGGDIDLLVELTEPVAHPAQLAAQLSARISRVLDGRGVDVLIAAPNLMRLPIHEHAQTHGIAL
jgi:predicted nucleotidyltransferase